MRWERSEPRCVGPDISAHIDEVGSFWWGGACWPSQEGAEGETSCTDPLQRIRGRESSKSLAVLPLWGALEVCLWPVSVTLPQ